MDVRIGVKNSPKELEVILEDGTGTDEVRKLIDTAVADGGVLWLTDRKGRQVGVPADKISFVEIGTSDASRRIGFGG